MNWYNDKIKTHPNYNSKQLTTDLDILYPPFAFSIIKLFAQAYQEELKVSIFETYRSQDRQLDLFNKGKTKLRTNGMHHFGVAVDIVFLDEKNNPSWNEKYNWKRLGEIGKSLGLIWGGDWPWDKPHFQLIPATVQAQAKIVAKNYPFYDPSIDQKNTQLLSLYKIAQTENFSKESIKKILFCFEFIQHDDEPKTEDNTILTNIPQFLFTRNLCNGCSGEDVKTLQKLLNSDPSTKVALQGVGSPNQESNYFGDLTKQAVQKFQIKYGITTTESSEYGIVEQKTRNKLQELFKNKIN